MVLDFLFIVIFNMAVNLSGCTCPAENQNERTHYIIGLVVWEQ